MNNKVPKKERIRLRSKSIKVTAGTDFSQIVINAAAYLTIHSNDISSMIEQPSIQSLRKAIMPAYNIIAEVMGPFLKIPNMVAADLSGLSVDLNPTLGTWSFDVTYRQPDGKIQPYSVKVSAQDGLNIFLRLRNKVGADDAMVITASI